MKKIWYAPHKMESYGDEEIIAVVKCLNDGWLAGFGTYTIEFEKRVANIFNKKYGLFVNSGSSACLLALASLDLPEGSEVITPACTFSTTVAPIIQLKLKPVFIDVELTTFVPNVEKIIEKINNNTKVIMLPNLIGSVPNWKEIRNSLTLLNRNDIILIEDSADTIYYKDSYSDISTTSFYSSHIITACGSGGMVMFNNENFLKRATMYRDWGRIGDNSESNDIRYQYDIDGIPYDFKFLYGVIGYNMKSSEVNSAFGLVQLNKLDEFIKIRRLNFERYIDNLSDVKEIILPDDSLKHNWLAIPLQTNKRLELLTFLEENNIQTRVLFSGNITRHPAFREYLQEFENSDKLMKDGFLLGCHHAITLDDVDYVCDKIKEFFYNQLPELSFIFPRHVKTNIHNKLWKECIKCIRTYYKTETIIIIDDNSDKTILDNLSEENLWMMENITIINSEFVGAGEFLPYYYYYKLKPSKKVVIINDSMFIQKPFDKDLINNLEDMRFLWDFPSYIISGFHSGKEFDNNYKNLQCYIFSNLNNGNLLTEKFLSGKWVGCFASSTITTLNFINTLQTKYNFLNLIKYINDRSMRQVLERTIGVIASYELKDKINYNNLNLFGSIKNSPNNFNYSYNDYINYKMDLPVIKCWNSR